MTQMPRCELEFFEASLQLLHLALYKVGDPSWSRTPKDHVQVQRDIYLYIKTKFSTKREIREFHAVVVQR